MKGIKMNGLYILEANVVAGLTDLVKEQIDRTRR